MTNWLAADVTPEEEEAIAAFMNRLAESPALESPILRDRGAIWWKAQLLRRWDEQQQAVRPLAVLEPIQLIAGLAAAAAVLLWALPSLTSAIGQIVASVKPLA